MSRDNSSSDVLDTPVVSHQPQFDDLTVNDVAHRRVQNYPFAQHQNQQMHYKGQDLYLQEAESELQENLQFYK